MPCSKSRRDRLADVIDCARYEMTTLYQQLADADSAVVLTDTDGVIIHMVASPDFAARGRRRWACASGGLWSEAEAGTNGMGTCMAAGGARGRYDATITSSRQFSQLTCSAVPVYDPSGEIAAVLDVTSRSRQMQQHLLVLLGMTARMIENRLIDQRFRNAHPLHFHSRPSSSTRCTKASWRSTTTAASWPPTAARCSSSACTSMDEIRARRIDEICSRPRSTTCCSAASSSSFHPVVTYRANAAQRFFAVARRPASSATATVAPGLVDASARTVPSAKAARRAAIAPHAGVGAAQPTFKDPRLVAHLDTARRVIARQTPVLLWGETGSGKEVFARAAHDASPHATGAFVAVNCASLPETLIEAELFGYRAGAFTGAQRTGRRGKILQADGGTLFLDEIGDMPLDLQARLLRVLDERQVTPLGTEETASRSTSS